MRGFGPLLLVGLLTACAVPREAPRDAEAIAPARDRLANGTVCRIGPDGGPVVADRGIGGTGAPSQVADRGIGGTGIVGVITGFASVCVDGLEVSYDGSAAVDIEGAGAAASALRIGQVVVIQAAGPASAPVAQTISVRREVTGRIEAVELGTGTLTIAGQPVTVPAGTWGSDSFRLGDWVAVSGLRRADGTLVASRLDAAAAGGFEARGAVVRDGAAARIGQLVLSGAAAADLKDGQLVTVSGQYAAGQAQVHAVAADMLFPNPSGYFGAGVDHLVLQGFVRVAHGAIWLNGLKMAADPGLHGQAGTDGIAIVSLERKSDGTFTAVGLRYTDHAGRSTGAFNGSGVWSRGGSVPPALQGRRAAAAADGGGSAAAGPAATAPAGSGGAGPAGSTASAAPATGSGGTAAAAPAAVTAAGSASASETATGGTAGGGTASGAAATAGVTTTGISTTGISTTGISTTGITTTGMTTVGSMPTGGTSTGTATTLGTSTGETPVGAGAGTGTLSPPTSPTSQLISSKTTSGHTTAVASAAAATAAAVVPPKAATKVVMGGSTSVATLSVVSESVTTSAKGGGSKSTQTGAVLAVSAPKSTVTKTIGTTSGKISVAASARSGGH